VISFRSVTWRPRKCAIGDGPCATAICWCDIWSLLPARDRPPLNQELSGIQKTTYTPPPPHFVTASVRATWARSKFPEFPAMVFLLLGGACRPWRRGAGLSKAPSWSLAPTHLDRTRPRADFRARRFKTGRFLSRAAGRDA
jgi:hypothetical protein